jgi:hypothetical protein
MRHHRYAARRRREVAPTWTIEFGRGATYRNQRFTVYRHGEYPDSSVLAGQAMRTWEDDFDTLEEAKAAYPQAADLTDNGGCTYAPPSLHHLSDREDY